MRAIASDQGSADAISSDPGVESMHFELEKQYGTWVVTNYGTGD